MALLMYKAKFTLHLNCGSANEIAPQQGAGDIMCKVCVHCSGAISHPEFDLEYKWRRQKRGRPPRSQSGFQLKQARKGEFHDGP